MLRVSTPAPSLQSSRSSAPAPRALRILLATPALQKLAHLHRKFLASGRLRPFLPDCPDYLSVELVCLMYRADPRMLLVDDYCVLNQATRYGQLDIVRWLVENVRVDITAGWTCYTRYDPDTDELIAEDEDTDWWQEQSHHQTDHLHAAAADEMTLYSSALSSVGTHSEQLAVPVISVDAADTTPFGKLILTVRDRALLALGLGDDSDVAMKPSDLADSATFLSSPTLPLTPLTPIMPEPLACHSRTPSKAELDALPILNPTSAVSLAVRFDQPIILSYLFETVDGSLRQLLQTRDPLGLLAHDAARRHHWNCLRVLVRNGAVTSFRIPNERSVWEEVLLADSRGEADLSDIWNLLCMEQRTAIDLDNALRIAARHGNLNACRVLVEDLGVDPCDTLTDGFRCTAHLPTLEFLLKHGLLASSRKGKESPKPYVHQVLSDPDSRTLAHVQLAVKYGAHVRLDDSDDAHAMGLAIRALRDAARWGCVDILAWLCEVAGANINAHPNVAADVFSAALRYGQWKVVRYLLRRVPVKHLIQHFVNSEVRAAKGVPVRLGEKFHRINTDTSDDVEVPDIMGGVETEEDVRFVNLEGYARCAEEADLFISFDENAMNSTIRLRAGFGAVRVTNGAMRRLLKGREDGVVRCVREIVAWCADRWDGSHQATTQSIPDALADDYELGLSGSVTYWLEDTLSVVEHVHQGAGGVRF